MHVGTPYVQGVCVCVGGGPLCAITILATCRSYSLECVCTIRIRTMSKLSCQFSVICWHFHNTVSLSLWEFVGVVVLGGSCPLLTNSVNSITFEIGPNCLSTTILPSLLPFPVQCRLLGERHGSKPGISLQFDGHWDPSPLLPDSWANVRALF